MTLTLAVLDGDGDGDVPVTEPGPLFGDVDGVADTDGAAVVVAVGTTPSHLPNDASQPLLGLQNAVPLPQRPLPPQHMAAGHTAPPAATPQFAGRNVRDAVGVTDALLPTDLLGDASGDADGDVLDVDSGDDVDDVDDGDVQRP